jgi:hypothetical protein
MSLDALLRTLICDAVQGALRGQVVVHAPLSAANDAGCVDDNLLTTAEAVRHCYTSTAAVRRANLDRGLIPLGGPSGRGTYMWSRQELDAFLLGARSGAR